MDITMKILSLEAQNILRLKAVRITPEGPVVVIGGENKLAAEKDMQVWIERVGDGDAGAIIIEDGEVANDLDNVPM